VLHRIVDELNLLGLIVAYANEIEMLERDSIYLLPIDETTSLTAYIDEIVAVFLEDDLGVLPRYGVVKQLEIILGFPPDRKERLGKRELALASETIGYLQVSRLLHG